jgi:hypothetical protein
MARAFGNDTLRGFNKEDVGNVASRHDLAVWDKIFRVYGPKK